MDESPIFLAHIYITSNSNFENICNDYQKVFCEAVIPTSTTTLLLHRHKKPDDSHETSEQKYGGNKLLGIIIIIAIVQLCIAALEKQLCGGTEYRTRL